MRGSWLIAAALAVGVVAPAAAEEIKPVQLRFAGVFPSPDVSLVGASAQMWMDEVTKRTNGKVTFQTFWGGALGKPAEHLTLVEKGGADVVQSNVQYTPGKFPIGQFEYIFPFGPTDPLIVTKAKRQMYEEFPEFQKDFDRYNIVPIMNTSGAVYQILSKSPVNSLGDLKGKKIGLIGRYFGRWVEVAGATPVVAPAHDRYTMLQTGVLDMDLLPLDLFASFKIYEQANHAVLVDAMTGNFPDLWINRRSFEKLPKQVQQIMLQAGKDVELRVATELVPSWSKKILDNFKAKGVTFKTLSEEERASWAAAIPDIPAEWAREVSDQGYPGWKLVARYQELTEQMGYKWPRKWGVKN